MTDMNKVMSGGDTMARFGVAIDNPPMDARIVFRETAEDTHGEPRRFDFFTSPT